MLKIPLTILVARGVFAVDKIVVHRYYHRAYSIDHQLNSQTFGEGGLARRTWSRDQYKAWYATLTVGYLVGYLCHFLLVQCLREFDHFETLLIFACAIKLAHIADMQQFVPSSILLEDTKSFVLHTAFFQSIWLFAIWDSQQDIAMIHLYLK